MVQVQEDVKFHGAWRVEAIDSDGGVEVTIFSGPDAEARAKRHARREYDIEL